MTNFHPEMIEKARQAKTSEELLAMAKDSGVELTAEEAATYFAQLNPVSGELSDDELADVAGGGCKTSVGSGKHTVVTSGLACFTGKYERAFDLLPDERMVWKRTDNLGLRDMWNGYCCAKLSPNGSCGQCIHLEFKGGTGYCGVS